MGKSKIAIIIAREFSIRVKKKSFILTTILTPLLFAGLMIVPSLIAIYGGADENLKISVIDQSGIVMPYLENTKEVSFQQVTTQSIDSLKKNFKELDVYAILEISQLDSSKNLSITAYSEKQVNIDIQNQIKKSAKKAVEDNKLMAYDIPNLNEVLKDIESNITINTFKIDEDGKEKASKVEIYMGIGYIASFMIYMFIFMFGSMVMRSVIEEKTTRIIEVIVSSVKPFQLMMGKILGVASVALTQFIIWIALTIAIVTAATSIMGVDALKDKMNQTEQITQSMGVDATQIVDVEESGAAGFLQALKNVDYFSIISCFIVYFVLGYLLYSSLFAAVGAAVDNEADTQQLILPVTMPLIIGLFIMLHTFQYPDSALSFWGSIIPFTSPMVMMARIAYGVPTWELALSIALLVVTFIGTAYVSGKVYRVGILMYGKKPGWKDIMKWLKY
ncbi:MAG: ABC transporter permease [Bacteroidales bacterium]